MIASQRVKHTTVEMSNLGSGSKIAGFSAWLAEDLHTYRLFVDATRR